MNDSTLRRWAPALLALLGLALFVPGLAAFGLWDPYEIHIADGARALATSGHFTLGPQLGGPPALVWLIALGFKYLGVGELGGRLPIALTAVVALLAVYYAGAPLVGRRGALLGAFALATCPGFFLGARQLTSNIPLLLATALAVGGLHRAAWPAEETAPARRALDLLIGLLGLALGQASAGILVGVVAPLAAVTIGLWAAVGLDGVVVAGAALTLGAIAQALWAFRHVVGYSDVLGGAPHAVQHSVTVATHLTKIGFSLFPWTALAPVATIRAFRETEDTRERFGGLLLFSWLFVLYLAATAQSAAVQDLLVPAGPALMLLVGGYLDRRLSDGKPLPFAALTVILAAVIIGRDFVDYPEQFIAVHMLGEVRWPGPLTHVPYIVMAFAVFFGSVIALGLGAPLAPASAPEEKRIRGRRILLGVGLASSLAFALVTTHYIIPQVSRHLSARDVYGKAKQLDPKAPIGQYRFNASGSSYYGNGKTPTNLETARDLFQFLGRPERVFVLAGSEQLPNIDQESRTLKVGYFVVDDTNSRYLVLSNRLGPNERDLNPLKRFISETPPKPQHPVVADFEGKVRLLGYDLPPQLERGQEFKIRLYFQVLAPVGGSYKVFIHFDGPGTRFNGDHVPLEGRFPTPNWVPGYYITDEHQMAPDRATQPAGYYHIYMGFFAGETRLKVTSGPQDGENRVKLGSIVVR